MNLKRLRGIASGALITIAAALFAGCMNSMAGGVDGTSRMATLQLSATGIPDEYAKEFDAYCKRVETRNASSRSILPDDPFDIGGIGTGSGQSDGLVLVLTGKSETGMTYGPKTVELTEGATAGTYDFAETITMDSMSWYLTLTAYKTYTGNAATDEPVLVGYCSVDLRNGSGTATFVMGIAGLTTPGDVSISGIIVDKDDAAVSYTMGIYRRDNGKDAGGTEKSGTLTVNSGANETFTYSASGVSPGTYLYTMIFYNSDNEVVGSFTDTIVINPGNALSNSGLLIDVIGRKPTKPEDLKAYLVDGSESSDGLTYNVKVTWTQSKYATNYELNLVELKEDGVLTDLDVPGDGTAIAGGTIYGMASMDKTTPTKVVKDFPGSAVFGTNSSFMMYGDDSCVLKLETGKVYEIQLRARNYIGTSEWADRVAGDDATQGTAYDAPGTQKINRLLIKYLLNGGTLKIGAAGTTITDKYAEYKSWIADAVLLQISTSDSPTATDNILKIGTTQFGGWLLDSGTGIDSDDNETTTSGDEVLKYTYKNVTVKASFGNKVTGNVSQEAKMIDIDMDDITVLYGLSSDITNTPTKTGNNYEVPQSAGARYWLQVTLSNVGTKYKNVKFEVWSNTSTNKETVSQSIPGQCQINTAKYSSGKVYVMVTADTENAKGMSQTLVFDVL